MCMRARGVVNAAELIKAERLDWADPNSADCIVAPRLVFVCMRETGAGNGFELIFLVA